MKATMKKYSVGIIGYGDFSQLIIKYLSPYADILVSSRRHEAGDAGSGVSFASVADVLASDIIIPSIPSQFFEDFFTEHQSLINPHAVVIDVCSVKVRPLKILEQLLPESCQIIGTHPLLGPASVEKNSGLAGLRCVVSRVRSEDSTYTALVNFLKDKLKLIVIERTPEAHDRDMAYVQGLSHYIGRVMDIMQIPDTPLATFAYEDLVDMKNVQGNDSWELFASIMKDNPYALEVNQELKQAIEHLDQRLRKDL